MSNQMTQRRGFYLVDSAVVLIVLSVMAAVTVPRLRSPNSSSTTTTLSGNLPFESEAAVYHDRVIDPVLSEIPRTAVAGFINPPPPRPDSTRSVSEDAAAVYVAGSVDRCGQRGDR